MFCFGISMICNAGCIDNVELKNKTEDLKEFVDSQNDIVDHDWITGN